MNPTSPARRAAATFLPVTTIEDARGHLGVIEVARELPFRVDTVNWSAAPLTRGEVLRSEAPAQTQLMLAVQGAACIQVAGEKRALRLPDARAGLLLPARTAHVVSVEQEPAVFLSLLGDIDVCAPNPFPERQARTPSQTTVDHCREMILPRAAANDRIELWVGRDVAFAVARLYFLYRTSPGARRGQHAHKHLWQLMVAISGSCSVTLSDSRAWKEVTLDRPDRGLLIPPMMWRELHGFTPDAVCLVLADSPYDEDDYIRDHARFVEIKRRRSLS